MSVFEKLIVRGRSVLRMHGSAETVVTGIPDGTLRLYNDGTSAYIQVFSRATGAWHRFDDATAAAALYAPIGADYLVGTSNATLTGEIVAGTSPGGELGGTWASPTVDTTHAEGSHSSMIATHASNATAHHSNANDHAEAHTVASHSDTTATGSELETLTDGSNADSLHTHAGGMTLVHSSNSETGPLTSTTAADAVAVTSLSIPANHGIIVEWNARVSNPAGASRTSYFGFEINTTEICDPTNNLSTAGMTTGPSTSGDGAFRVYIPPRITNYTQGATLQRLGYVAADGASPNSITQLESLNQDSGSPVATVTSLTIRYYCVSASSDTNDLYLSGIRVWELAD